MPYRRKGIPALTVDEDIVRIVPKIETQEIIEGTWTSSHRRQRWEGIEVTFRHRKTGIERKQFRPLDKESDYEKV